MLIIRVALLSLALWGMSGCATIMNGTTQDIRVTSTPVGAVVECEGGRYQTPCKFTLSRKADHTLTVSFGRRLMTYQIEHKISGAFWGNLLAGGIIGAVVDSSNGSACKLVPDLIHVDFLDDDNSTIEGRP